MSAMPASPVYVVGDPPPGELQAVLAAAGWAVTPHPFSGIDPREISAAGAVVLRVTAKVLGTAQALCRRWRIELGEQFVPMLWVADGDVPPPAGLDAGADVVVPAEAPDVLVAQMKALLRIGHLQHRLAGRAAEAADLNHKLQQAHQQLDGDLELTRRLHRAFLPAELPDMLRARFGVCYRPRSRIGGDFYDVIRLDEDHAALYVADAMGRGLPASSLLSVFVKKSLRPKEILGRSYRLVPPGEVLDRLNRELVNLSLPEPPFVTMVYSQLNCRDGTVSFARAAHPYPLYLPVHGEPTYWTTSGTLLGVFDASFPAQQKQLNPGDKLVLISDGVHPAGSGPASVDDPLAEAVKRHRELPAQPFADAVARDLLGESRHPEDFTLLVVEMATA